MWWMIGLSLVGVLAVLFFFGLRNEGAVKRDWEMILTPKGRRVYDNIEGRLQAELALADATYEQAHVVRGLGSMDEAVQLLDVGYRVIEQFAPNMLRLLAAMATFSRMVAAMAPVKPLRPRDFKLAQLVSLAYLNRILHQFLVSTTERFRLRLYVLGKSFGLATRFLLQSTQRIVRREPEAEREWQQVEAIRADFRTLTEESLESLRVLLTSLSVEHRENILKGL